MRLVTSSWKKIALCAACCAAAFALAVVVFDHAKAQDSVYVDQSRAEMGDDGLVYGVPYEGEDGLVVIPDMTRVRATNGCYGYISTDEMYAAIVDYADSEAAKSASIQATAAKKAEALKSSFADYFGVDALSIEDAASCAETLTYENGQENARAELVSDTAAALANAVNQGLVDDEVSENLVVAALEAESDDSQKLEGLALADSAETASAWQQQCLEQAEQMLANKASEPIGATSVDIDAEMFSALYQMTQEQVSVSIPVRSKDGAIVGEYVVDRM